MDTGGRALQFLLRSFLGQGKMTSQGSKSQNGGTSEQGSLFFNNFWTNWARAKPASPSGSSRWYTSEYVYHDLIRSRSSGDLRSRDLYMTLRSKCISFDASWWAEHNETMHGTVALFYAKLLVKHILVTFDDVTWPHGCHVAKFASR